MLQLQDQVQVVYLTDLLSTDFVCQRLWTAMYAPPLPVGSGLGGLGFRFTFERFACVKSIYSTECFKNLKTIPCPLFILVQNTLFSDPITVHTFISPSSFLPTTIFHCTYICIRLCFLPFCVHAMVHSSLCALQPTLTPVALHSCYILHAQYNTIIIIYLCSMEIQSNKDSPIIDLQVVRRMNLLQDCQIFVLMSKVFCFVSILCASQFR